MTKLTKEKIEEEFDDKFGVDETEEIIGTWYGKSVKKTDTGTLLEIIEFQRQSMERMQKQHQRDQDFMEEECEAPTVVIEKDVLEIIKENTTSILAMPLLMAIISGVIVYLILN